MQLCLILVELVFLFPFSVFLCVIVSKYRLHTWLNISFLQMTSPTCQSPILNDPYQLSRESHGIRPNQAPTKYYKKGTRDITHTMTLTTPDACVLSHKGGPGGIVPYPYHLRGTAFFLQNAGTREVLKGTSGKTMPDSSKKMNCFSKF
jgi:hypothetical protein